MKITDRASAWAWATDRCARRECCRADLAAKLHTTDLDPDVVEEVLDALEREGFVDATRYARAFVHDKSAYERWGRLKISRALALKRIPRPIIEAALAEEVEEDAERDTLTALLRNKLRTLHFDPNDRRDTIAASQKLVRFATARGFAPSLIFDVLHTLLDSDIEEDF